MITHPIPPVISTDPRTPPRVLILGSFPSVRSREAAFFYGHPQNRFWRVLAALLDEPGLPGAQPADKAAILITHGIALWDVIAACEIQGSADSSITRVTPTDLRPLLAGGTIRAVCTNGGTATRLYRRYQEPFTGIPAIPLPSTSPANAAKSLDDLIPAWSIIQTYL